jgi:integrase
MPAKQLSDRACQAAKPSEKLYYRSDGDGLRLQVRPNGARYWMFRFVLAGKEGTLLLGSYPELGLAEARGKAEAARGLVKEGRSPVVERKVRKHDQITADQNTFGAVASEWLQHNQPRWSAVHHERNEGLLRRILLPTLNDLPVAQISREALMVPLKAAYTAGTMESARRARAVASQIFAYAIETGRAERNPGLELARSTVLARVPVKHHAALQPEQVGPMLRALKASGCAPTVKAAIELMMLTGLRDYSLRSARWSDIDLEATRWTVPAEKMKHSQDHAVPLPSQAIAILTELKKLTGYKTDGFVFASSGKEGFLAENTLRLTLHRLGFKVTAHGFRSLLTDLLNKQGFNPDAVERQLAHVEPNEVRRAYLRSDFMEHRVMMMQWFADWAYAQRDEVDAPALPDNVVPMRRVA